MVEKLPGPLFTRTVKFSSIIALCLLVKFNMVETNYTWDLQKTDDSSLADNEIASLMKTLASDQYRETPGFPKKSIQPFRPLSLNKIASQACLQLQTFWMHVKVK